MVFEATQSFDLSFYVSGGFLMIAGAVNYKFYGFYQENKFFYISQKCFTNFETSAFIQFNINNIRSLLCLEITFFLDV